MKIECEDDPKNLIREIGDPSFSVCDESWDEIYRHDDHPRTIRIIDCEDNQHIDITGQTPDDSRRIAMALIRLLNQNYIEVTK
ncbi:MAG: hypothetical protein EHM34_05385 [Nitrosopumilales archaeon]|nr:MAG: hypothetical protein EHM34_05385 [Nitrosopumilales archaeon]